MRKYPILKELPTTRDYIDTFGGYNHNLRIGANEFYDMKNLSSDNYPVVSTRKKRGIGKIYENPELTIVGLIDFVRFLCPLLLNETTSELYFEWGGTLNLIGITQYDSSHERQVVNSGSYIIIFPDKLYLNTADMVESGDMAWKSLETVWESPFIDYDKFQHSCDIQICDEEGRYIIVTEFFDSSRQAASDFLSQKTEPDVNGNIPAESVKGPIDSTYYCDSDTGTFYYWHPKSKSWLTQEMFIKIWEPRTNFADYFNVGDAVRISGFEGVPYEMDESNKALNDIFNNNLDDSFIIMKILDNTGPNTEIVLKHNPIKPTDFVYQVHSKLTIEKRVPNMDFVIENNNRLWGCRYGKNRDGEFVNEIYASALGDFTNWECFAGTSQDSYIVSLGSKGSFTGAISYLGNPVFFKQNCIHTILGTYPATYQVQTTECKGVQNNCGKSLAIVDGVLFYKSIGGVSAFTGSLPSEIGMQLNEKTKRYDSAVAGTRDGKYYLSVKDSEGTSTLFVYDTAKGLWHKEDNISIDQIIYITLRDSLCCRSGHIIYELGGTTNSYGTKEDSVPWFAETGIITCSTPDKKYISKMSFRMSMDVGTRVYVYIEYDSSGVWEQIASITGTKIGTFTFPIKPKRCDHFRLKIEGTDSAKIYSISKTIEQGSDK